MNLYYQNSLWVREPEYAKQSSPLGNLPINQEESSEFNWQFMLIKCAERKHPPLKSVYVLHKFYEELSVRFCYDLCLNDGDGGAEGESH